MSGLVMAVDQGTTSSRCILFDKSGCVAAVAQKELKQIYPKAGWVEHDPEEILASQLEVCRTAISSLQITAADIAAIGITNQRETTIMWDRRTGKAVHNAIVWQCRRTAAYCDELRARGFDRKIKEKTGLMLDAYFSATKIKWILDNVDEARELCEKGDLLFGTVDTFLVWHMTNGKEHVTDYSNASRTMLFNIHSLEWDNEILAELGIPKSILPKVLPSSHLYGTTDLFGGEIKIAGIAGDQQAALFGQCCFEDGMVKNTYGTGCFMLMNTGSTCVSSTKGLLSTIAWGIGGGVQYALEGSIFVAGAAVQWLRDELGIIDNAASTEHYANEVSDTNGVYVVPAFAGLAAPYWDSHARGAIVGLTRGASKAHIIRATLEAIAYQTLDVIKAMEADSGINLKELRVDGGACMNDFLMQFQADILNVSVLRPKIIESTALGAAYLAGLAVGYYESKEQILKNAEIAREFKSEMLESERVRLTDGWVDAVRRTLTDIGR